MTGLRQRLSLILGGALLLMAMVWLWPLRLQQYLISADNERPSEVTQNAAIIGLIEATPREQQPLVLRAVSSPMLNVSISDQVPSRDGRISMPGLAWAARINLDKLDVHDVAVTTIANANADDPHRRPIRLDVGLPDGRYLSLEAEGGMLRYKLGMRLVFGTLAAIGLIGSLALWLLMRQLRPLEQLVTAVEHFGKTLNAPAITAEGALEVRQLVGAFNRMRCQIRALLDARTRMLAAISHDLGTYLTRLRLRIEYMEDEHQRQRAIEDIEAMQSLMDDTLELGRLEQESGSEEVIDLAELANRQVAALNSDRIWISTQGPASVRGRRHALARVLDNLVGNALKHAGNAEVSVLASASMPTIELRVEDRGPGIPAATRELALEPFYRGDAARNLDVAGSGLGLSIVADIVRRLHGQMALEDRIGGGLCVRITLPRAETG